MIQAHIHKLLFDHDCVIIPDFGGLITHYEAARIHPVKHTMLPPSKRVAFNEKLKINDGLLISTFAYDERISAEEAQQQVTTFVRQLQEELTASHRFELKGIGLFRLNAEQKIEFEYIPSQNFLNDGFGLPELICRPVFAGDATAGLRTLLQEKKAQTAVSTGKPTLRRKLRRFYDMAAIFAITGLTGGALYLISQQTNNSLSTLNPISLFRADVPTAPAQSGTVLAPSEIKETYKTEAAATENNQETVGLENRVPEEKLNIAVPKTIPAEVPVEAERIVVSPSASGVKSFEVGETTERKKVVKPVHISASKIRTEKFAKAKAETNTTATTIKAQTGRYYIIAGGFSTLQNAERNRQMILRHSQESKIILPFTGSILFRVSITDFASKEEALQDLPVLRKKFGPNIWILNY